MPYYGPWVQADDYSIDSTAVGPDPDIDVPDGTVVSVTESGHVTPSDGQVKALQEAALTATLTHPANIGPSGNGGRMVYETNYAGGIFGPHSTIRTASAFFSPRAVDRKQVSIWAPINEFALPDGAIGWQWQSDLTEGGHKHSGVTSCTLHAYTPEVPGALQYGADDTVTPTAVVQSTYLMGLWTTGGVVNSGSELTAWDGPGGGDLVLTSAGPTNSAAVHTIDITASLDSEGVACVYERLLYAADAGPDPVVPRDLTVDERGIGYGHPFFLNGTGGSKVAWVLRPPVFRWIFESPPVVPRQRIYPSDNPYASSARRIYPPPKAQQINPRKQGGYW